MAHETHTILFSNGIMNNEITEAELSITSTVMCLSVICDSKPRDHVGT